MSGLAAILARRTPAGIYRWHGAFDVADIAHTIGHAGWLFGYVDGWRAQTKAEFLRAVGDALDFPDYYGNNFDALADCLRDTPADPAGGLVLLWDGWGPLAAEDETSFRTVLALFQDRVTTAGGRFVVLLRGEGPLLEEIDSID
jgi:RNAse (barnase) inhibitor barstar